METDILIAGLMTIASVVAALVILLKVAHATRDEPRPKVKAPTPQPTTALPAAGW
jgi:hypothetical protein